MDVLSFADMKRGLGTLFAALFAATAFAIDELPAADDDQTLEIDPPLLIQNRAPDGSLPDPRTDAVADVVVAQLTTDLERAQKRATAAERLYRSGILAQVEAEDRALRVVRLEAQLANAQLRDAQAKLDELKTTGSADDEAARELHAAELRVTEATANAARATEARQRAEVASAAKNVERQRKLLAVGSGRKADVNRAQEKLTELQQPRD